MRTRIWLSGAMAIAVAGCQSSEPVARVAVPDSPTVSSTPSQQLTLMKPMPAPTRDDLPPPPFDDSPLVSQEAPETPGFIKSYNAVGRPRIVVFVNRTLQGDVMEAAANDPAYRVDHSRTSSTGVSVERGASASAQGYYNTGQAEVHDKFTSNGPGEYHESTSVYLQPSQYDEVQAKSLDYEAIETILTDFLSADGQVVIISPTMARQKLTEQQVKDLESGRPQVSNEIVQQLGADILVQATAHPTKQTPQGLEVRLICEAMNVRDGQSLGRAVVDVPPPLEKTTINRFSRYCARKLMHDMTNTWAAPPMASSDAAAPAASPAPSSGTLSISPSQPAASPSMPTTEPAGVRAFMSAGDGSTMSATTGMPSLAPATMPTTMPAPMP